MQNGNRGPGSPSGRHRAFRPISEGLEDRRLLTSINLTAIQTAAQTTPAAAGKVGVQVIGSSVDEGAGYVVTDVGDVTGSGFDSYAVAAPTVTTPTTTGVPLGTGGSAVYLVFGAPGVTAQTALGSIGDLGTLNQTLQVDPAVAPTTPVTNITGFFGVKFVTTLNATTGQGTNSALGASIAALGDINNSGFDSFMIGAPNDSGGGRAYIVYGGTGLTSLSAAASTIDLEPTAGTTTNTAPTKVVGLSLTGATTTDRVGTAVAGIGNFFNTSTTALDVAVGDPGFATNGTATADTGAVFALTGQYINSVATGTTINLATVGTNSNPNGIIYTGISAGDLTGSSLAGTGNLDGTGLSSLLIGAPGVSNAAGRAYIVYGSQQTTANATLGQTLSLQGVITTPQTTPTVTTPLQGIAFNGLTAGQRLGFSVTSIGNFDSRTSSTGAGLDDILIGAPGTGAGSGSVSTGFAALISYPSGTSITARPTNVAATLDPTITPTTYNSTYFSGGSVGDLAGYSVSSAGNREGSTVTTSVSGGLLIGAPGTNSGSGAAYVINDNSSLTSNAITLVSLGSIAAGTNGTVITATNSSPGFAAALGACVSGLSIFGTPSTSTLGDASPAVIVGAPGFTLVDPVTLVASTTRETAGTAYALLGGQFGFTTTTSGGGGTGGGGTGTGGTGTGSGSNSSTFTVNTALSLLGPPVFTGDNFGLAIPTVSSLSHLTSYQPLPVQLAYNQFLPAPGFRAREEVYHHPGKGDAHQSARGTDLNVAAIGKSENKYLKVTSYPGHVFRTSKFKPGKAVTFTHKPKVIPRSEQTETFVG